MSDNGSGDHFSDLEDLKKEVEEEEKKEEVKDEDKSINKKAKRGHEFNKLARMSLPTLRDPKTAPNLLSIIGNSIGKDLTKLQVPV